MYPIQCYSKYSNEYSEAIKKQYFSASKLHQVNSNSSMFYVENILKQPDETEHESSLDSIESSVYDQEFEEDNNFSSERNCTSPKNDTNKDEEHTFENNQPIEREHSSHESASAQDYSLLFHNKRSQLKFESHSRSPSPGNLRSSTS